MILFVMKIFSFIIFLIFSFNITAQDNSVIFRWNNIDTLIRDNKIDKDDAIDSIEKFVHDAVNFYKKKGVIFTNRENWVFPMSGFTKTSYRDNGYDYRDEDFDYFQGAEFHGHPAHDIFILDNDKNSLEDSTGGYVNAIAMVSGVIITSYSRWKPGDFMRAGNYINLFDPRSEAIFYYSHLDSVFVKTGDIVKAGDVIGFVGRTGRKALFGKTHIHISYYKIIDGYPQPVDIIGDLYKAENRYREGKK
jgi:hypothetical protein